MKILGISCFYHDAAACLLVDGIMVAAAAEERFSRIKHDNNFPKQAIAFCLSWLGITIEKVDAVVFYEKPIIKFHRVLSQYLENFPNGRKTFVESIGTWFDYKMNIGKLLKKEFNYSGPIRYCQQHLAHAASAYYLSPFDRAVNVTFDGVGEWATTTVGLGNGSTIRIDREIHFPHSLGLLYSAITAYLGFAVNDAEYKVMGLSAFGNPKPFRRHMDRLINQFPDGSFRLNMQYFDYTWSNHMFSGNLVRLFGHPARKPESAMQPHYADIAASLQAKLEATIINLLNKVYSQYKIPNLTLAGGVALNAVANGKILSQTPFKRLFIPPDPGDGGAAMGAAFWWNQAQGRALKLKSSVSFSPFLGPSFSREQIQSVIDHYQLSVQYIDDQKKFLDTLSHLLIKGNIVAWFQGRMEWGPRALGNRSILADPRNPKMKYVINEKVKHREQFRPFAPSVLLGAVKTYFKTDKNLPESTKYMILVYPFTKRGIRDVPATVHVDGTGRLQTVARADNPLYYDLIATFGKKTGVPVLLNTSFNVRGEPIVCSPRDAIECFLKTDIDILVMDRFIVKKS
ncbi:hypothetical protein HY086_03870 [Candidatus Gottesmanbacteria bacterium]|nr:hypothetical protein [Candidatus Gottesmanbacteria bacterium]